MERIGRAVLKALAQSIYLYLLNVHPLHPSYQCSPVAAEHGVLGWDGLAAL
jgi:hypothetical protein